MSGVSIPGPTQAVLVNANGQLGTATAAFAQASKTDIRPLRSRVRALRGLAQRQQRQLRELQRELRELREEVHGK